MNDSNPYKLIWDTLKLKSVIVCLLDKQTQTHINYLLFNGEPLEHWEVGQLLGGN